MEKAAKGTGVLAIQSGVNALLGTFLFMYMARVLTKMEMGVYGAIILILTVAGILGRLGLNTAASRFIPHFYGNKSPETAGVVAKNILYLSIVSASILSGVFFALSPILSRYVLQGYQHTYLFQVTSFALFFTILGLVFSAFIQGLQMFKYLAFIRLLAQISKVTISITFLTLKFSVEALFYGIIAFNIVLIALAIKPTVMLIKQGNNRSHQPIKPILSFGLPMVGYELVSYLYNSADQYIVLSLIGIETLGTYTVAITAASLTLITIGIPLSTTLTPKLSEVYGNSDVSGVVNAIKPASRYISLFFIPATLGLAILSPLAIQILASQKYIEAWPPVTIMCLGIATYGFSTIINSALIAIGKTDKVMMITLIASAAGLALTAGLTEPFGILGAASAKAIMYGFLFILSVYVGSKVIPISLDNRAILGSLASSTVMAVITYIIAFHTGFRLILLPFYITIGLLTYGLTLSAMRILTLKDIQFLSQTMPGGKYIYTKLCQIMNNTSILSKIIHKIFNL